MTSRLPPPYVLTDALGIHAQVLQYMEQGHRARLAKAYGAAQRSFCAGINFARSSGYAPIVAHLLGELGYVLVENSKPERALKMFQQAVYAAPRNDSRLYLYFSLQGMALTKLGRLKEALEVSEESIAADPTRDSSYLLKSITLFDLGNTLEALRACKAGLEAVPTSVQLAEVLEGLCDIMLNETDKAAKASKDKEEGFAAAVEQDDPMLIDAIV